MLLECFLFCVSEVQELGNKVVGGLEGVCGHPDRDPDPHFNFFLLLFPPLILILILILIHNLGIIKTICDPPVRTGLVVKLSWVPA